MSDNFPGRQSYPNDLLPGDKVKRIDIYGRTIYIVMYTVAAGDFIQVYVRKPHSTQVICCPDRAMLRMVKVKEK